MMAILKLAASFAVATGSKLVGAAVWDPSALDPIGTVFLLAAYWPVTATVLAVVGGLVLLIAGPDRQAPHVVRKRLIGAAIAGVANALSGGFIATWALATAFLFAALLGMPAIDKRRSSLTSLAD